MFEVIFRAMNQEKAQAYGTLMFRSKRLSLVNLK